LRQGWSAAVWAISGFFAGAVFWHFVGFWSFLGSIVLTGPDPSRRVDTSMRPVPSIKTASEPIAPSLQAPPNPEVPAQGANSSDDKPGPVVPEQCAEIALDRAAVAVSRRTCPVRWIENALPEAAAGKQDSAAAAPEVPAPSASDWSVMTIETGRTSR